MQHNSGTGASYTRWDQVPPSARFYGGDMGVRVMEPKLLLALHLRHLDEESLANQVYQDQLAMGWPDLATEVGKICEELGIENVNTTKYNKYDYKTILSEACHRKN